jgi:hypothetical protein
MSVAFYAGNITDQGINNSAEIEILRQHFAKILQICVSSRIVLKIIRENGCFCVSGGIAWRFLSLGRSRTHEKTFSVLTAGACSVRRRGEWKAHTGEYQSVDYVCTCPCCGKTVHGGKPVE